MAVSNTQRHQTLLIGQVDWVLTSASQLPMSYCRVMPFNGDGVYHAASTTPQEGVHSQVTNVEHQQIACGRALGPVSQARRPTE